MIVKTLSRGQAQEAMTEWINGYPELPAIDSDYLKLRTDMQKLNSDVRSEIEGNSKIKRTDYYVDYRLGLLMYEYLRNQPWFSMRVAANDGFWRFLSLKIVPDIVAQRWGKDNDSHYWSMPARIWLRSIWWFVHLSWQGSKENTEQVLSCSHFTTDTILNFEERTGRNGTYIDAYRRIIYHYSRIPESEIKKKNRSKGRKSDDLFRVVMKLNTAKLLVFDPALFSGGVDAYARSLFEDAGVIVDAT